MTDVVDSLTLVLRKPVTLGQGEKTITVSELQLTEPTMKQLRESAKAGTGLDQIAKLIELNAGVLPAVVDGLYQRDVDAASDFFARFASA